MQKRCILQMLPREKTNLKFGGGGDTNLEYWGSCESTRKYPLTLAPKFNDLIWSKMLWANLVPPERPLPGFTPQDCMGLGQQSNWPCCDNKAVVSKCHELSLCITSMSTNRCVLRPKMRRWHQRSDVACHERAVCTNELLSESIVWGNMQTPVLGSEAGYWR